MTVQTRALRSPRPARWRRGLRAPVIALAGAVALLVAVAAPAWAHVEAEGVTDASGITTVTFAFEHGCAGSPTKQLTIQLPDGTTEVTPQNPTGWTSTVSGGVLDWTGGPIPDTEKGEFVASMRIVGTQGSTVFLPTKQICVAGENDWLEKTDDPEADNAAPRIVLTQTVAPDSATTQASTTTTAKAGTATTAKGSTTTTAAIGGPAADDTKNNVGVVVGGLAVLVIVVGGVILYLRNRRPKTPPPGAATPAGAPEAPAGGTGAPPDETPPPTP